MGTEESEQKVEARYTSLHITPTFTKATATAPVSLDSNNGLIRVVGISPTIGINDLTTTLEGAVTDVDSIHKPGDLRKIMKEGLPKVVIYTSDGEKIEGRLFPYEELLQGEDYGVLTEDGKSVIITRHQMKRLELDRTLSAEPSVLIKYSGFTGVTQRTTASLQHRLNGLSIRGIFYELSFNDKNLQLKPYVIIDNQTSINFENISLSLLLPDKPTENGLTLQPFVGDLEEERRNVQEQIRKLQEGFRRRIEMTSIPHQGHELDIIDGQRTTQSLEGRLAEVSIDGTYSLRHGENKKIRLSGYSLNEAQFSRGNVLVVDTSRYHSTNEEVYTSIQETVRFKPPINLNRGILYMDDGTPLLFPEMRAGSEYELILKYHNKLQAKVLVSEVPKSGQSDAKITYRVSILNNTGEIQEVEVNIPLGKLTQAQILTFQEGISSQTVNIGGSQYYSFVRNVSPGKETLTFEITLS